MFNIFIENRALLNKLILINLIKFVFRNNIVKQHLVYSKIFKINQINFDFEKYIILLRKNFSLHLVILDVFIL
jgi:hypothetical protein